MALANLLILISIRPKAGSGLNVRTSLGPIRRFSHFFSIRCLRVIPAAPAAMSLGHAHPANRPLIHGLAAGQRGKYLTTSPTVS